MFLSVCYKYSFFYITTRRVNTHCKRVIRVGTFKLNYGLELYEKLSAYQKSIWTLPIVWLLRSLHLYSIYEITQFHKSSDFAPFVVTKSQQGPLLVYFFHPTPPPPRPSWFTPIVTVTRQNSCVTGWSLDFGDKQCRNPTLIRGHRTYLGTF